MRRALDVAKSAWRRARGPRLKLYDDSLPLPAGAARELSRNNPRLRQLRAAYARLDLPVVQHSRWRRRAVSSFLNVRYFRGESLIYWHYREAPRETAIKYGAFLKYVQGRDRHGLLQRLGEDGAFGCWSYTYPGVGRVSRDLLESVNEIWFLERHLGLSDRPRFSVLDIGAGYGRLAHRMTQAYAQLDDYCCVDAVAESTFLSEYYLRFRGAMPPARVVSLDVLDEGLRNRSFDLAVNIHGFSECTYGAIAWWLERLKELRVPQLLIVPNEPDALLSLEADWTRRDFRPLVEDAGYVLTRVEPVVDDPAVRELLPLNDRFYLFTRSA